MECKYNNEEFCTNDQCPICGDYCPVPDSAGVCKHEERGRMFFQMTPKSCMSLALLNSDVRLDGRTLDNAWNEFVWLMTDLGYIKEEDKWKE